MPQIKSYKGNQIKKTHRMVDKDGKVTIKMIFKGDYNKPGPQITVSEEEYKNNVSITYSPPKAAMI